jgi:D-alanyl-D-alanine carboxypeptidase/D-alanyl-D-alanine-endopeptidase (penicillin-binding protein 4)
MKTPRRSAKVIAAIVWSLGLALVGAAAQPGPTVPPRVASLAELQAKIGAHLAQPRFAGAAWGVKVVSLETGRTLYEHAPSLRLSPASNTKLYTAALALDLFGGDERIRTPLLATAAPDGAGVVNGDVIVSGRGDPSWNPRRPSRDFAAVFAPLVAALREAGVRRITGDLVADATYFHAPPHGASWTADDLNDYYGAEISALTLAENYVDLRIAPATQVGAPGTVEFLQPHTGLGLDNRTVTTAAGGVRRIDVLRLPGETTVRIFGELPLGAKEELAAATVPRPAAWFATALKAALAEAGIAVDGAARSVRWPEPPPAGGVKLGEVVSPPLRERIESALKPSQNLETEILFARIGEARRTATTPDWVRADELAVAALQEFLRRHALREDEVIFDEGSGLSRNNLTTAAATVALLQFMAQHREAAAFAAALPVAGADGTLRRRMQGTPAEGNVRAKTGTLRWAATLSGYVTSAAGERLAFSLMLNRHVAVPGRSAGQELDEIAVLLANYAGPK